MKTLLELLTLHGGSIVCSSSLDVENINQARASGRMFVDEDGIGFIWIPKPFIPTTPEEVEFFETWYPLDVEIDENFLDKIKPTIKN